MSRRTLGIGLTLVLAFAAGLAGCASVPTTGRVSTASFPESSSGDDPSQVHIVVPPPRPNSSPAQVVAGFVDAMAASDPTNHYARPFLSSRIRNSWQPKGVEVLDGGMVKPSASNSEVTYTGSKTAEIRADGSWAPAPDGVRWTTRFRLARDSNGEWRITNPPSTLLMSSENVERTFGQYDLYFFDPTSSILVPDPIFLSKGAGIETRLVNALLNGPTAWLSPAVRTALPKGVRLAAPSVTVDNDVATIDLNDKFLLLGPSDRQRAAAQVAWTLQLAGVGQVRFTVRGKVVRIGNDDQVGPDERYDPVVRGAMTSAYALSRGRVVQVVDGSQPTPVPGVPGTHGPGAPTSGNTGNPGNPGTAAKSKEPRSVAVSLFAEALPAGHGRTSPPRPRQIALISGDGRELWLYAAGPEPTKPFFTGHDITRPTFDRFGRMWFVDVVDGRAHVYVTDPRVTTAHELIVTGLTGRNVLALRISRDGTRLAGLFRQGSATRLFFGRVDRADGLAVNGVHAVPLPEPLTEITDLSWSDPDQVVVVGRHETGARQLLTISVDGSSQVPASFVPDTTQVAAAPGESILVAGGSDGRLYVQSTADTMARANGWKTVLATRAPAYPG